MRLAPGHSVRRRVKLENHLHEDRSGFESGRIAQTILRPQRDGTQWGGTYKGLDHLNKEAVGKSDNLCHAFLVINR